MTCGKRNISLLVAVVLLSVNLIVGLTAYNQHVKATLLNLKNQQLASEKLSAEAITRNVIQTTLLMHDLARATARDKDSLRENSERRVVVIRKLVKGDNCAVEPVPHDANEQLRAHRNEIR